MDIGAILIIVMEILQRCRDDNNLNEEQLRERLRNRPLARWALRSELRKRGKSRSEIREAIQTVRKWNPSDDDLDDILTSALED